MHTFVPKLAVLDVMVIKFILKLINIIIRLRVSSYTRCWVGVVYPRAAVEVGVVFPGGWVLLGFQYLDMRNVGVRGGHS